MDYWTTIIVSGRTGQSRQCNSARYLLVNILAKLLPQHSVTCMSRCFVSQTISQVGCSKELKAGSHDRSCVPGSAPHRL